MHGELLWSVCIHNQIILVVNKLLCDMLVLALLDPRVFLTNTSAMLSGEPTQRSTNFLERSCIPAKGAVFITLLLAYRSPIILLRFAC